IPPGKTGELKLNLSARWQQADALALQVKDPTGRELWTWVWPLAGMARCRQLVATPSRQTVSALENNEAIEIKAGELVVRISKQTGLLLSVQRGTQGFSLANGPRAALGAATLTGIEKRSEGSDYVVTASFDGSLRSVTWRVRGNGWVQCAYTYSANGPQDFHGVLFDYPESLVAHKKWLGDGPYRVWKNRLRGVSLNVWENAYNNTITGWSDWVYPEFKGCFANVRWLQLDTKEGLITALPGRDDQFVQVLTPDFPPADLQAKTALSLPRAGLAFLQAIPPIGSKFHAPKDAGPQAQPTIALGHYSGAIDFYFGPLPR
ncbi:MAG TPA: glycoside hydrolase family 2, partial [Bacillota bacterium]|nr:glycoside hydrolase family 2 [Bacillota bacterium]